MATALGARLTERGTCRPTDDVEPLTRGKVLRYLQTPLTDRGFEMKRFASAFVASVVLATPFLSVRSRRHRQHLHW